ncbi:MAG: hypothetical protein L3J52_02720 [Proteobacteria bacterium]|nr:hypothetical protein [Pseudomonadota bacterium]
MNTVFGFIYVVYLVLTGLSFRLFWDFMVNNKSMKLSVNMMQLAHSFFIGIVLTIIILNILQLLKVNLSDTWVLIYMALLPMVIILLLKLNKTVVVFTVSEKTSYFGLKNLLILVFALCLLLFIYLQSSKLPLLAWDAWTGWAAKAQLWLIYGFDVPLLRLSQWVNTDSGMFNLIPHYPDGISLLFYLPAVVLGWQEGLINIVWVSGFFFFVVILYHKLIEQGASFKFVLFLVFLICSIPFVNVHIVFVGYADIWLAIFIFLAITALYDYCEFKTAHNFYRFAFYASSLPMFKLEGWSWLMLILFSYVFALKMNLRQRMILGFGLVLTIFIWLMLGGFSFLTPYGEIIISPEQIDIFSKFSINFNFSNVSSNILHALFLSGNWSLLWFTLPFVLCYGFFSKSCKQNQLLTTFLLSSMVGILLLFYFTYASEFAKDTTSLNRIILQLVPTYVYYLAISANTYLSKKSLDEQSQNK